jgi:hypothetical protein
MNEQFFKDLNAELGAEFDLFVIEHPDWSATNVPSGAVVVMQTDNAEFNAWTRGMAERNRSREQPPRPLVLVHVRELRPPRSRIVRAEAEIVA